ncbi:MAG: hypothetical protein HQM10_13185 [Candidatus Riflebacteria bacterium]|nr:hypothetical protein [Candidatus Riflebacteria bacterium]
MSNLFKTFFISFMLSVIFTSGSPLVFAEKLPPTVTVDYKLLFLLHPLMAEFDWSLGRHIKKDIDMANSVSLSKLNSQMNQLNDKAKSNCAIIEKEIEKVTLEIAKIEQSGNLPLATTPAALDLNEILGKIKAKKKELLAKIEGLKAERDKHMDSVFDPMYLSREESQKISNKAIKEIDAILEKFSSENENALIIDKAFLPQRKVTESYFPTVESCTNLLNIGLKQTLLEFNMKLPVPEKSIYANDPETLKKFEGTLSRKKEFEKFISTVLSKYPAVNSILGLDSRLFLIGGKNNDITSKILKEILISYKVSESITEAILSIVDSTN